MSLSTASRFESVSRGFCTHCMPLCTLTHTFMSIESNAIRSKFALRGIRNATLQRVQIISVLVESSEQPKWTGRISDEARCKILPVTGGVKLAKWKVVPQNWICSKEFGQTMAFIRFAFSSNAPRWRWSLKVWTTLCLSFELESAVFCSLCLRWIFVRQFFEHFKIVNYYANPNTRIM